MHLIRFAVFGGAIMLAVTAASPQTAVKASTGQIQGKLLAAKSATPMGALTVSTFRVAPSPVVLGQAVAAKDGTFTIGALPTGHYTLCVLDATKSYANPCEWADSQSQVDVTDGKITGPITLSLKATTILSVHVNDLASALFQRVTDTMPPRVMVTVRAAGAAPHVAAEVNKSATGMDYQVVVPYGSLFEVERARLRPDVSNTQCCRRAGTGAYARRSVEFLEDAATLLGIQHHRQDDSMTRSLMPNGPMTNWRGILLVLLAAIAIGPALIAQPTMSPSTPIHFYGGGGQYVVMTVTAAPGVTWAAGASGTWLTVNGGYTYITGTGTGTFTLRAAQNTTNQPLTDTLELVLLSSGQLLQSVPVSEDGFVSNTTPSFTVGQISSTLPSQTISVTFTDPNGIGYLELGQIGFGHAYGYDAGCLFQYLGLYNQLYMDTPNGFVLVPAGQPGTFSSTWCQVNAASSSVVVNGTSVTLNLALSIRPAGIGALHLLAGAIDYAGGYSPNFWTPIPGDDWNSQPQQTGPFSVSVANNNQRTQTVGITATDPNGYLYVEGLGSHMSMGLWNADWSRMNCSAVIDNPLAGYVNFFGQVNGSLVLVGSGYLGSGGVLTSDYCSIDLTNSSLVPAPNPPGGDPNAPGTAYPSGYQTMIWSTKWIISSSVTVPQVFGGEVWDVTSLLMEATGNVFTPTSPNPVPTVSSLSPALATVGGAAFTLTINGTSFIPTSQVQWNASNRTTTYVSATQLTAAITAADIAATGTPTVTVSNPAPGGGTSSGLSFAVNNPPPTLTAMSPMSANNGAAPFTLTVTGSGFMPSSQVQWNASARTTTYVSPTQMTASILATDLATSGTAAVVVSNPPSGGASSSMTFTISGSNPAPALTTTSPAVAHTGAPTFTLTLTGTGFVAASVVQWNGSNRATTYVSSTQLTALINSSDVTAVGTANITVVNPTPGGGTSMAVMFPILPPYMYSRSITFGPATGTSDLTDFPLLISGMFSYLATTSNGGNVTSASGYDIVFATDAACYSQIPWEIESYDPTAGNVNFWVRIATFSHSNPTTIYMCYGNSAVTTFQGNVHGVWDSTFSGVYHLSNGSALSASDSTVNGNSGTINGQTAVAGKIDDGASFSGAHGISLGSTNAFPTGGSSFTLSAWINAASLPASGAQEFIVSFGTASHDRANGLYVSPTGTVCWTAWDPTLCTTATLSLNTWYHVVATYDGTTVSIYLNGTLSISGTYSNGILDTGGSSLPAVLLGHGYIGDWVCSPCSGVVMNGILDEVRVASTNRSAAWVAAEYSNQLLATNFFTLSGSPGPMITGLSTSSGAIGQPVTITGQNFGGTQGTSTATFNGMSASVISWGATSIQAVVPVGATTGNVVVTVNNSASDGIPFGIMPGVVSLSQQSAAVGAAQFTLTVTGTSFVPTSQAMWNNSARQTTYVNATTLNVTVNASDLAVAGIFLVAVQNPGAGTSSGLPFTVGSSTTNPTREYIRLGSRVIAIDYPPSISGMTSSGRVGTAVTITGSAFGTAPGNSTVTFNGVTAQVNSWGGNMIVVTVPAGATTGSVVVTVNSAASNGVAFTVTQ